MRIVHWKQKTTSKSGMESYLAQLVHVSRKMGLDCQIALSSEPEPQIINLPLYDEPITTIAHSDCESKDCVNIFHDGYPANFDSLPHKVFETHASPYWMTKSKESLEFNVEMLKKCDLTITRWKDQEPYWFAFTKKPVIFTPPGVDLDYWKPTDGKRQPVFLWADSWREGMKEPWQFLYDYKKLFYNHQLKLVNIPPQHQPQVNRMLEALELQGTLEGHVKNIKDYYSMAEWLYSPIDNNVRWEAAACGCRIWTAEGCVPDQVYDIRETIATQVYHFREILAL